MLCQVRDIDQVIIKRYFSFCILGHAKALGVRAVADHLGIFAGLNAVDHFVPERIHRCIHFADPAEVDTG